jgi:SPP1 gp7 family putative phage head morphogenesis protein
VTLAGTSCCPHDLRAAAIDVAHARVLTADAVVAKAGQLSEVAQMARLEQRLREYLLAKWNVRVDQAVAAARSATAGGSSAKSVASRVETIMGKWEADVSPTMVRTVKSIYKLARIAGWKKATKRTKATLAYDMPNFQPDEGQNVAKARGDRPSALARPAAVPRFDTVDAAAADALARRQVFWIGEHYDEHLSDLISNVARETMVETGASRAAAARVMEERVRRALGTVRYPGGFAGSASQYMEGLAANAATVARAYGQLRSFAQIGITRYTIVNPGDDRTCPVCSWMNGKVFTVQQGLDQIRREQAARSPDGIRAAHPLIRAGALRTMSPTAGRLTGRAGERDSARLASGGQALPPYHFRCRCAVDIDDSVGSFNDLAPTDF